MTTNGQKRFSYAVLVLPAVLIYLTVVAFPTIFSIILSLTNYNGGRIFGNPDIGFVGISSYIWMLTEPAGNFYRALGNNMLIVGVSVFGQIPLGFILAYILTRKLIKRGRSFFQTMIFLPYVISPVIIGVLFNVFILSQHSVYMEIVKIFNPDAVFTISKTPIAPVLVVVLWMFTGFYMIVFMAHMQRIDPSIDEAARIDGAKESQVLRYIILPSMTSEIVTCAILAISGSLRTFDLIYAMTAGGPAGQTRVLSIFMYNAAFGGAPNYPLANAISTVMVLISVVLIIVTRQVGKLFKEKDA
ncbi:MAG: sugar ABC transporter permease [Clostridiales bacterium]|jgi:raffinose/stachyose/melibiose transport system permease protein|nr:sugar ABC transporter permease [Clostridiales bacterium]